MAAPSKPASHASQLAEPVAFALATMAFLVFIAAVLQKAGVPLSILLPAVFTILVAMMALAANNIWPARLADYVVVGRRVSAAMAGIGQLMAIAPAGLAMVYLGDSGVSRQGVIMILAGLLLGLWASTLLFGRQINRSGAYSLPQYLEARFGSTALRIASTILLAAPMIILFCGQILAFSAYASHLFDVGQHVAALICLTISVILIWLPGARGFLLASAISFGAVILTFTALYWFTGFEPAAAPPGQSTNWLKELSASAVPYADFSAQYSQAFIGTWAKQIGFIAILAMATACLPLFSQFHSIAASAGRTVRSALAATIVIIVAAALFAFVKPSGLLLASDGSIPIESAALFAGLAEVALLSTLPASGAVLLFGLANLASLTRGPASGNRGSLENRRQIELRMTVLALAIAAGWIVLYRQEIVQQYAAIAFSVCAAAVFPVAVVGTWWRGCSAIAALSSMFAGLAATGFVLAASQGLWDLRALVSERSEIIELLSSATLYGAGLTGTAIATAVLLVVTLLFRGGSGAESDFFDAIHQDLHERPINETAL